MLQMKKGPIKIIDARLINGMFCKPVLFQKLNAYLGTKSVCIIFGPLKTSEMSNFHTDLEKQSSHLVQSLILCFVNCF
jgi:hypothetical protein